MPPILAKPGESLRAPPGGREGPHVVACLPGARLALLSDGGMLRITCFYDGDGEPTDDFHAARSFVCGTRGQWRAEDLFDFTRAVAVH